MLLYIKGTSADLKKFSRRERELSYIISEAKVGVEAQGFIKDFVFTNQGQCNNPTQSRAPLLNIYIIGEQTKGVQHQGFMSGSAWRPGRSTILIDL